MNKPILTLAAVALALGSAAAQPARADVNVGVLVGATGPGASLGIPYRNTFSVLPPTLGGEKVNYLILDDGTDPSNAARNARKLITEDKVDLIIGATSTPTSSAVTEIAAEARTAQISLSPLPAAAAKNPWAFAVPQPAMLMMGAVAEQIRTSGAKTVGFIGFSDSWGDLVYNGTTGHADSYGYKVVANERYARLDTSVTSQVLRVLAANPDAVVIGGSGTPAVLPMATLVERGYKGKIYHNPGIVNADFLRVGGKNVEGAYAPTGPVIVAEQLPDANPIKKVALEFTRLYEGKYGAGTRNAFAAYSYDAYLLADRAVAVALKKAKPGTPEFRLAIRDALEQTTELVGTHAIYTMSATDHTGVDQRGRAMVRVENGAWKFVP